MQTFIKLTRPSGEAVWLSTSKIVAIEKSNKEKGGSLLAVEAGQYCDFYDVKEPPNDVVEMANVFTD